MWEDCLRPTLFAQIAQLVEQRTENPRVTGSIPVLGICCQMTTENGILAQLVEHLTFNQVVRGSNPRCLIFNHCKYLRWFFCSHDEKIHFHCSFRFLLPIDLLASLGQ